MIPEKVLETTLRGFLSPIAPLLDDTRVTEILINGPHSIYAERGGKLELSPQKFQSRDGLMAALRLVAQGAGRTFDRDHPILEARLPDGSRLEAILDPICSGGPGVAIRRFSREKLDIVRLVELGAMTETARDFLEVMVLAKRNIIVAGGTGSGKTSILNALAGLSPRDDRIVVMEDSRELALNHEHVLALEARPPDAKGRGGITIRDLFKATLRMRPDRIVVGEIRSGEALDLIQAMTSGHGGCMSTVHATYPVDTMNRLETMAMMGGVELPLSVLRSQLASAVDLIVQTSRLRGGRRAITHITEVHGLDENGRYQLTDLFLGRQERSESGGFGFTLTPTHKLPACASALAESGLNLPKPMLARAQQERSQA